jgi:Flp pilus assembly protein TadG
MSRVRMVHPVAREDRGSTLPFVLLCFLLALLLVAGTVAASAAFLAQRDLQSDCDGAAVAGAAAVDPAGVYADGALLDALPLTTVAAQDAVAGYAARAGLGDTSFAVTVPVPVDGAAVAVRCGRRVTVPFGPMFGLGGGVDRTADSSARSPVRP